MKLSLTKEGTIKEEEFIVSGRKIPLLAIRRKLLEKQVNLGVVRSILNTDYTSFDVGTLKRKLKHLNPHTDTDELSKPQLIAQIKGFEQNRHLLVWSDHASVMNHGHLMLTVKTLYDEGFYLTREEYKEIYGKDLDIETLIEEPQLYIFSRCRDSLQGKVAYTDTRREDILEMNVKIRINGHENMVTDTMKYFNGDHPEQASESGNLEGGDVPCAGCGARAQSFIDLEYCFRAEHLTLEDRRLKVLQGPAGRSRRNGGIKPFFNLKKDEIFDELDWRQIKYNTRMQKKELEMLLKDELGGVARVPLLCQGNEFESLSNTPLKQYEVLSSEALHDIKEHIRNLWEELPQYLTDEESACFSKVIEATTKQKDKIRGVDFRLSAIIMCNTIRGKCRPSVQQLLDSLVEISRLLYAPAEERTPKFVLRFYNMTFQHAHLCISIINKPKSLTQRKFYGQYFHSISTETALNSRVVSPKSTNTEDEERHFSRVSSICSATSSRAPDHIIINSIIRMQAEMKIGNGERENSSYAKKESEISKFNKVTPRPGNSTFQAQMLSKGYYYQAHLERISDYIAVGPGIWWHKDEATGNIVFHDGPDEPETRPEGPLCIIFGTLLSSGCVSILVKNGSNVSAMELGLFH